MTHDCLLPRRLPNGKSDRGSIPPSSPLSASTKMTSGQLSHVRRRSERTFAGELDQICLIRLRRTLRLNILFTTVVCHSNCLLRLLMDENSEIFSLGNGKLVYIFFIYVYWKHFADGGISRLNVSS